MKRFLTAAVFGAVGLVYCFAVVAITDALTVVPRFPAFAGESDFGLRAAYFFLVACPGFFAIGAWIGWTATIDFRRTGFRWLGVVAGTIVTFAALRSLAAVIEALASSNAANTAVLVFIALWLTMSALGVVAASRITRSLAGSDGADKGHESRT